MARRLRGRKVPRKVERERAKPTVKVYYFHKFTFISTFMWIYWILFCCCCWCCPVDLFVHCCCWQNFHPRVWPHHSWGKKRNGNDDDSGEREFAHVRAPNEKSCKFISKRSLFYKLYSQNGRRRSGCTCSDGDDDVMCRVSGSKVCIVLNGVPPELSGGWPAAKRDFLVLQKHDIISLLMKKGFS